MKAGFGLLIYTTHATEAHLPLLSKIRAAGYDGVEVPVFEGDEAHYARLRSRVADAGLAAMAIGVVPDAARNPMSPDPAARAAGVDHLRWMADCSRALGAEVLAGPIHQPLGQFSGKGATADELAWLADSHRALADYAPDLTIAVEPLNRFEAYALNTAAQAAAHVRAVGRPNFGFLYDTFHANIEERDPIGVIPQVIDTIAYVHISENDRGTPGRGHVDLAGAIRGLKAAGYDGWFTIEAFGQALPDLAAATRVWRPLFDSEDEVLEAGIRVIRSAWNS